MRRQIKNNVSWVGYLDWELETFHGDDYSIYNGSSQNAYLIEEEKTVLIDTIWTPHRFDFVEILQKEIDFFCHAQDSFPSPRIVFSCVPFVGAAGYPGRVYHHNHALHG